MKIKSKIKSKIKKKAMDKIIIEGGRPLSGSVRTSGSKNAALPILVSSLLTDGMSEYENVPQLRDIQSTIDLLMYLGARVSRRAGRVCIDAGGLDSHEAPYDLVRKMRASILVLGPLLARLKKARVSLPGGCAIGARPINLHLKGMERLFALGSSWEKKYSHTWILPSRKSASFFFKVLFFNPFAASSAITSHCQAITIIPNISR